MRLNLRDIDRLVAEEVMRYNLSGLSHLTTPYFSTNIADAWRVVEKLIDEGYDINVYNHNKEFNVEINIEEDDKHLWFYGEADSAPLAICLAALEVVGVEVEGEE
jgi:Phage ABA sandwich domain